MQLGLFSFECFLVRLNEQKKISPPLLQLQNALSSCIKFEPKTYGIGRKPYELRNIAWVMFLDITQYCIKKTNRAQAKVFDES